MVKLNKKQFLMTAELESKLNVQSESLTESDRKFTSMRTDLDEFRNLSTSLSDENMRLVNFMISFQQNFIANTPFLIFAL